MKKTKGNKLFKFIFFIFLMGFIIVYFSELTGYYEYQNYKKKTLTEEQIKKFETDVRSGNKIDINEYLVVDNQNYNNTLSKVTSKISDGISKIVKSAVEKSFSYISKAVDE